MRKKAFLATVLAASMLAAATPAFAEDAAASDPNKIVNIGSTSALSSINPLNMDVTFMSLYAQSMMFLPLTSFDQDANTTMVLADSITTDDNKTFTVKLKDVKWSDGEPVTADDVIWTMLKLSSPEVANASFDFSNFEGFDDSGMSAEGATEVDGIRKVDDKTVEFVAKDPMSMDSFVNNIGTWALILPSHVLKDVPADQLSSYDWFNHPDVVDGPYILDDYDPAHYISYSANENYSFGAPKIGKLNFKIVEGSDLLAGLQNGEIDVVQPAIAVIPDSDLEAIKSLDNVTTLTGSPVTDQMTFFNTRKVSDARVRKAIVEAIDRQTLVDGLLSGNGVVKDGFVSPASPYYDDTLENIPYDPDDAKKLLEEAGWDSATELEYYTWSDDTAMTQGAQIIQQQLADVGVKVNLHTVDLDSLMGVAGTDDVDLFSVQYTITPIDYFIDAQYLVDTEGDSWTGGYFSQTVDDALNVTQTTTDKDEIKAAYRTLDEQMIADVPMFSMYFISNSGAVSNRVTGATPSLYGTFDNINEWDVQ